jgi:hypothetical protein
MSNIHQLIKIYDYFVSYVKERKRNRDIFTYVNSSYGFQHCGLHYELTNSMEQSLS